MNKPLCTATLCSALVFAFLGCQQTFDPVERSSFGQQETALLAKSTAVLINGYQVNFDGRVYENNQTTFSYAVTGTGVEPALSHFTIELPPCAPELAASDPSNSTSINTNPQTGIFGIEWHLPVEPDDSQGRTYSITFPGNVPLGEVRTSVKSGSTTGVGVIAGPCAGFEISGTVYVDADDDQGTKSASESGIANVTVTLTDQATAAISTTTTDASGEYTFKKIAGTYTVSIDFQTSEQDFNEQLAESFLATSAAALQVTVGPDNSGNDFGFAPRTEELIVDLEAGTLSTDGKPVKFWLKQFRHAIKGNGRPEVDAATLQNYLNAIEGLYLSDPFQFDNANELQAALDILDSKSKADVDQLRKQLLAAELNEVSGRGITNADGLQAALISWGESLVAENQTVILSGKNGASIAAVTTLTSATTLFSLMNSSGGGGGSGD